MWALGTRLEITTLIIRKDLNHRSMCQCSSPPVEVQVCGWISLQFSTCTASWQPLCAHPYLASRPVMHATAILLWVDYSMYMLVLKPALHWLPLNSKLNFSLLLPYA